MPQPFRSLLRIPALCLCFASLLAACAEDVPMPGEIASVNGQAIFFQEAESRRIHRFAGLHTSGAPVDGETLRSQYAYVVRQLIEEVLICQYMEKKGLRPAPDALEREEALIRGDYPKDGFAQMLVEEGINLDLWRASLLRGLVVRQFMTDVLRPEVSISADEVNAYYKAHSQDFIVPEQWRFMRITGVDKKQVEEARNRFLSTKNATAVQQQYTVTMHDIRTASDRLPEEDAKELAGLTPWKAAPARTFGREFKTFVLMEIIPASVLGTEEIYRRVEQVLVEEKLQSVYADWIRKQTAKADIRLAPVLLSGGNATLPLSLTGNRNASSPPSGGDNGTLADPEGTTEPSPASGTPR